MALELLLLILFMWVLLGAAGIYINGMIVLFYVALAGILATLIARLWRRR